MLFIWKELLWRQLTDLLIWYLIFIHLDIYKWEWTLTATVEIFWNRRTYKTRYEEILQLKNYSKFLQVCSTDHRKQKLFLITAVAKWQKVKV